MLYEFFTSLPYWRMQPFEHVTGDAVALAEPGQVYVVYLPHGGQAPLDLSAAKRPLAASWFNPRDGRPSQPVEAAGVQGQFHAPDGDDWVLLLRDSAK